jgi:hypothetical protein
MVDKRTFNTPEQLFYNRFSRRLVSLDKWLIDAYDYYKSRELDRISDADILQLNNEELIKKLKDTHLSTIELKDFIYFSIKDYDNNNLTDIHIPFTGTMGTFDYCPDSLIDNPPVILAEVYNIEDAENYDPSVNCSGTGFRSNSSEHNVMMLLFKDSEIDKIESTLNTLKECVKKVNEAIHTIESRLEPELIHAINEKRTLIQNKRVVLKSLGLSKGTVSVTEQVKRLISFKFYNAYTSVVLHYSDGTKIESSFSKSQAKALVFMKEQHELGRLMIPQSEITEKVGSVQTRIREVFKSRIKGKSKTHPLFNTLIRHDNRGNYGIIQL